jgi:hypothetical protein
MKNRGQKVPLKAAFCVAFFVPASRFKSLTESPEIFFGSQK